MDDPNSEQENHTIKACYFDIDGTLIDKSGRIHPRVLRSIEKLHEKELRVGIATGRPWFAARNVALEIGTNAPCLSYSGALLIDRESENILSEHLLHPDQIRALVQLSKRKEWYLELYTGSEYFIGETSELTEIHQGYLHQAPIQAQLESLADTARILKAVIPIRGRFAKSELTEIEKLLGAVEFGIGYGASHPEITFLNITSPLASRQNGLKTITQLLGCSPAEIMCFGDGEADIPFLEEVGFGVAMGNAPSPVKEAARFVTHSVEEQGIATFLEKIFFSRF